MKAASGNNNRLKLLAKIHIARQQLGMADEAYRALLFRIAGVHSAKDLNDHQPLAVLAEFKRLGFQPQSPKKQGRARPKPARTRVAMVKKIEALLAEAGRPWDYADATALRMFKIQRLEWLDDLQVQKVMQALIMDAARHRRLP